MLDLHELYLIAIANNCRERERERDELCIQHSMYVLGARALLKMNNLRSGWIQQRNSWPSATARYAKYCIIGYK